MELHTLIGRKTLQSRVSGGGFKRFNNTTELEWRSSNFKLLLNAKVRHMHSLNAIAKSPTLSAAVPPRILHASFVLQPDGQMSDFSDAFLQMLGYAAADGTWRLPDLIADGRQARQLTDWLAASQGLCALALATVLLRHTGDGLAAKLWVTAMPAGAAAQALCVVQALHPEGPAIVDREAPDRQGLARDELAWANNRLAALIASQQATLAELRRSEAALRASEARLKTATEGSGLWGCGNGICAPVTPISRRNGSACWATRRTKYRRALRSGAAAYTPRIWTWPSARSTATWKAVRRASA
jgi:PAS domain-containing protein